MNKRLIARVTTLVLSVAMAAALPVTSSAANYLSKTDDAAIAALNQAAANTAADLGENLVSGKMEDKVTPEFTEDTVDLTLEQAIERAQTVGVQAESAKANKATDEATAAGYKDTAQSISSTLNAMNYITDLSTLVTLQQSGITEANREASEAQRDFAKDHIDSNYETDMNNIKLSTVKAYYGVVQARENLSIAQDQLQLKKDLLSNNQKKYDLGTISQITLTQAENDVKTASASVDSAQSSYDSARRSLNLLCGYDLNQSVNLTSDIEQATAPAIDLDKAVKNALNNRNEIATVNYGVEIQELLLKGIKSNYSISSADYKKQYASYQSTVLATETLPKTIETEIRTKATEVLNNYDAIKTAEKTLSLAESALAIAQTSYRSGASVATDLTSAEITVDQANLGVMAAIASYNTSALEFEIAQGYGTERISF